ncbi:MAG: VapC toxin family PIN domain ribonuclease [Verrucomicrobia bacterium]|nr:VapC toxin family PIN domain ribonuclease [Verrucomicrobiota bacterium]MBU1736068.1 VapC toxin family PIN domain ribonuclease [Verrucomicrobiota bacterium]MBU1857642.1 VapC toxin family PIN domain ribonuclease [Verrucomicrobiota bacterium]
MLLADTSIWVDHFRHGVSLLDNLLTSGQVATHPFVIGELACGNLANRAEILELLSSLPSLKMASHAEALHLIQTHSLHGAGIGWIDIHLLSSALLNHAPIWTRDHKLNAAARKLGIAGKE